MRVRKRAARAGKTFLFACSVTLLPSLNATPTVPLKPVTQADQASPVAARPFRRISRFNCPE